MLARMVEPGSETTLPRLWTPSGFREDDWTHAEDADALSGNGRFILPVQVALSLDPQDRKSARERLGVLLKPGDKIEAIGDLLDELSLIALSFTAFNDGRSLSKAELLRSRHGFRRAIRATGQVLVDQLPHMLRVGFDEFEVSHPILIERLERGQTGGLGLYGQPSAGGPQRHGGYAWRRTR